MNTRKCNKCTMLKSIENFSSYIHKKTGNLYTRHICNTCFRMQNNEYKKSTRPRTCIECNETKPVSEFYNLKSLGPKDKRHNICKVCTRAYEKTKQKKYRNKEDKGEVVLNKPNTYISEQQKEDGFQLMEALGFTFNEENGKWFKDGFKNPDGTFVRLEEKKRLEKERRLKEIEELDVWSKIRYLREQGYSVNQISNDIGVNSTAVFKFLYYGKEVKLRNRFE